MSRTGSRQRRTLIMAMAAVLLGAGCGGSGDAAAPVLRGDPGRFLVALDQLIVPDFTVFEAAHPVGPGWLVSRASDAIQRSGFQRAAQVHFFRQQPVTLATANGPVDVTATAAAFASGEAAADALRQLSGALDARAGATPVSTGTLGDGGHAISEVAVVEAVSVVQISVVWRVANLVNSIVIEGRYGAARLDDALQMAHVQTSNEVAGGAPSLPRVTPASPSSTQ